MEKKEKEKEIVYDFGEKKEENINGNKIPVEFHTPKYKEAKAKAIELLESKEYKEVLKPSDFWILVNTYSNKTKAMYSGLIISHDGCLKINDSLEEELKFKPECMSIDKDGYNNSLVFSYMCKEQGIYEVGEVSQKNCKNDYPYAMALKRCFDRVVLKNSKIAYAGIYSDSESDEFIQRNESVENNVEKENNVGEDFITEKQMKVIEYYYRDDNLEKLLKSNDIEQLEDMPRAKATAIIKAINEKKAEKEKENE